jgi:DNA-binding PadR family transcriptional regulator
VLQVSDGSLYPALHKLEQEGWIRVELRLRSLFQRPAVEAELNEELRFHLDRQTEALVAQGMPYRESWTAARRSFGGVRVDQVPDRACRRNRPDVPDTTTW